MLSKLDPQMEKKKKKTGPIYGQKECWFNILLVLVEKKVGVIYNF